MNDTAPASATPTDFTAKATQLKALFDELCASAPAAAKDVACEATEKAKEASRKVIETVRKHPLEAAAVAIGTGLLVWWLVSRRHSAE